VEAPFLFDETSTREGFTWPMTASGWTTAAGWMKLPDASRAAPCETPACHGARENEESDLTRAADAI